MTDTIEQEALALFNEVARERGATRESVVLDRAIVGHEALCRAIERDKAFRQEVSDAVEDVIEELRPTKAALLSRFIIAKPLNPLAQAWLEAWPETPEENAIEEAGLLLAAVEKRGGKIIFNEEQN